MLLADFKIREIVDEMIKSGVKEMEMAIPAGNIEIRITAYNPRKTKDGHYIHIQNPDWIGVVENDSN